MGTEILGDDQVPKRPKEENLVEGKVVFLQGRWIKIIWSFTRSQSLVFTETHSLSTIDSEVPTPYSP